MTQPACLSARNSYEFKAERIERKLRTIHFPWHIFNRKHQRSIVYSQSDTYST